MKFNITTVLVVFFITIFSFGQDANKDFVEENHMKDWGFSITPYALIAAQSTDVGGEKIRQSFNDLTSLTNSGFQIRAGVRYKKFLFTYDGTFADLGHKTIEEPLLIDISINQNISDFRFGYIVYNNYKFDEEEVIKGWSLTANVGAKYWRNKINLDWALVNDDTTIVDGSFSELQEWWDLMVGINTKFIISNKFLLGVDLSAGGFGIGDASKFAYDFTYLNSFKIRKHIIIDAGFRNFRYNREDGEGENELETTVNVLGPLLGISFVL